MTKWEYASMLVSIGNGEDGDFTVIKMHLNTESKSTNLLLGNAGRPLNELNKMGKEGWEVISANERFVETGVSFAYLLKRPLID
jgi:hypothetical protein